MSDFDLLVHTPDFSLGVVDGLVAASGPSLAGVAQEVLEVPDGRIVPGWIDAHVHFNEPGRTEWEGLETGSLALAAAGGTTFFDMPLNSTPPVVDAASLEKKRLLAGEKAHLDFALWGGLTPDSLAHLEAMAEGGAVGFKAFMCPSGLEEYPCADPATLRRGMKLAAGLRLPVSVHAEISRDLPRVGHDMAAWLASRPPSFELVAIRLALELAGETRCALHLLHVTCPEGIDLVTRAKEQGVDVTVETCPHYLLLDEEDASVIGAAAKCAPPLRPAGTVARLWEKLRGGEIDTLGSDHSPSSPELKTGADFFAIWGGIAGIQHGYPLLLDREPNLTGPSSANVAQRFKLRGKGSLRVGNHADFSIFLPDDRLIEERELLTRHPLSPYLGRPLRHRVQATFLRGAKVGAQTKGRFLRPDFA